MNEFYCQYVRSARTAAEALGLMWNPPFDEEGDIDKQLRWNLTLLAGLVPPPVQWLGNFRVLGSAIEPLQKTLEASGSSCQPDLILRSSWREFYQAVLATEVFIKKNKPNHAINNVGKLVRLLGTCCAEREPWDIRADDVRLAYNVALHIGDSGKIASLLTGLVRTVIDAGHLADRAPLAHFCRPFGNAEAVKAERAVTILRQRENANRRTEPVRRALADRKRDGRLPDQRAFWELVGIVFTEAPKTFMDAIRFAQVVVGIMTGFRLGEHVALPLDWERWRDYQDLEGRPAGSSGGISRSLMIRHFAEKQDQTTDERGFILYEAAQHVPPLFQEPLRRTLDNVARLTCPLRERLQHQTETGRLLPEYDPMALVPAYTAFLHAVGNIRFTSEPIPEVLASRYRASFDVADLEPIRAQQLAALHQGAYAAPLRDFFRTERRDVLPLRLSNGDRIGGRIPGWAEVHVRVGELERFVRTQTPTKMSDFTPFNLADRGLLYPHDLLFLMPIRALAEARSGSITDIGMYAAVGRADPKDLFRSLGGDPDDNLFVRYLGEEGRGLALKSHSLRHLQNSELLRLGVADAIVTKRFRKNLIQTADYDHRSLGEELDAIDLPPEVEDRLGPKAAETYKLIVTGRVSGPVTDEFRLIQKRQGDDAAFDYLAAEAGGLHATPFGVCVNHFAVNPCPKHLECFNGCRHLGRTDRVEERRALETLRDRMAAILKKLDATPENARGVGWKNQAKHAADRLAGIEVALATRPGGFVFPDGPDRYSPIAERLGTTVIDSAKRLQRAEE